MLCTREQQTTVPETWSIPQQAPASDAAQGDLLDRLAAHTANGDKLAFERIYGLLVDDLYGYVRGQCDDDPTAEDLLAEVFLRAWRSASRYRGGSRRYRRWIFAIAHNLVRDHWRARRRDLPLLDVASVHAEAAAEAATGEDEERRLKRAIAALTDEQRQVVALRYYSNMSHRDIAAIMGKREGAVRALLVRALRRMRKVMSDAAA